MAAKFTVYKDKRGEFRFNLKAGNGEIIAVGESYPDKKSCLKGIDSIRKNAPVAELVDSTVEAAKDAKAGKKDAKAPKKDTKAKAPKKDAKAPKKDVKSKDAKPAAPKPEGSI